MTTIIAVDKDRTYLGGCILPGIRLSAQLLKETTLLHQSGELRHHGGQDTAADLLAGDAVHAH